MDWGFCAYRGGEKFISIVVGFAIAHRHFCLTLDCLSLFFRSCHLSSLVPVLLWRTKTPKPQQTKHIFGISIYNCQNHGQLTLPLSLKCPFHTRFCLQLISHFSGFSVLSQPRWTVLASAQDANVNFAPEGTAKEAPKSCQTQRFQTNGYQ